MIKIYPYKVGSASVRKLKEALNAVVIKTKNSNYRFKPGHIIINWGNSRRPESMTAPDAALSMLNQPEAVAVAADKLETFETLTVNNISTVPYTTDRTEAETWLGEGHKVFARHSLTGHSGEGIEVIEPTMVEQQEDQFIEELDNLLEELHDEADTEEHRLLVSRMMAVFDENTPRLPLVNTATLPDAPLYTKGIVNAGEYRVHVFAGEVILYQKKSRRVDEDGNVITAEGEGADVRNLASDWVYRTGNLRRLERVEQLAIGAIEALDLDFGAVDIIMSPNGDVFVLEVNTAPGLGNTETLEAYVAAFNELE